VSYSAYFDFVSNFLEAMIYPLATSYASDTATK